MTDHRTLVSLSVTSQATIKKHTFLKKGFKRMRNEALKLHSVRPRQVLQ